MSRYTIDREKRKGDPINTSFRFPKLEEPKYKFTALNNGFWRRSRIIDKNEAYRK